MRVRCVKLIDVTGAERSSHPALTQGREYVVLAIDAILTRHINFRIECDDNAMPALFRSDMFITTQPAVPAIWQVSVSEGGRLQLAPPEWLRFGFWEDYFNDVPEALAAYKRAIPLLQ